MRKIVFPISPHGAVQSIGRVLLAVIFLLLIVGFNAAPRKDIATNSDGWVFHKTVNNVDFYHKLISCDGKNVVLLKINNKNDYKVKIAWSELFTTQAEMKTEGTVGRKQMIIMPGEVSSAGCGDNKKLELVIFPIQVAPTHAVIITGFEFKNIEVVHSL